MYQSKLFTKTRKEAPKDEVSKNAQLLIRAGFINKEMAGVYSILPLGLRVINKIANIVREEMNQTGGVELQSTALQKKEVWEKTNRWDDKVVDNWFKTQLKNDTELGLAFTHEEPMSNMMTNFVSSYKDLPIYAYDIRTVFRNEARAKSGIMRGREFFWKALYSFSKDEKEHNEYYEKAKIAYKNIYNKVGLGDKTFMTFASGGTFSKYSHEFQTLSEAGEDNIFICDKCKIAVNQEIIEEQNTCPECGNKDLRQEKAIEVGNIFSLGTKFSKPFELKYKDEKGEDQFVFMGSYGLGISRLMGTVVEVLSDDKGIVWPESLAPFKVHLLSLGKDEEAEKIYNQLSEKGIEVLFDDRDTRAGEKFADSDLLGIPYRVVVSGKSLEAGGVEFKKRNSEEGKIISIEELIKQIS
ncbi:prolyl-tRNA synthetase [Candidatus Campbellbacteria bacterium RIFOXYC2_FULL_35_25]|uniref:Proline--tRNA ligase n=1 Tax=Candidatus Campbellbacteria bacterium RIFOXYC2_FULL_35_25 TaxID=1797582 RepID=A0A1F5EK03_9BACT|nr:MAG: prolyl-tRNA synthetase [Candidatus Campbellbacteria bacterium RIFOXYC2_FULL_35_25]